MDYRKFSSVVFSLLTTGVVLLASSVIYAASPSPAWDSLDRYAGTVSYDRVASVYAASVRPDFVHVVKQIVRVDREGLTIERIDGPAMVIPFGDASMARDEADFIYGEDERLDGLKVGLCARNDDRSRSVADSLASRLQAAGAAVFRLDRGVPTDGRAAPTGPAAIAEFNREGVHVVISMQSIGDERPFVVNAPGSFMPGTGLGELTRDSDRLRFARCLLRSSLASAVCARALAHAWGAGGEVLGVPTHDLHAVMPITARLFDPAAPTETSVPGLAFRNLYNVGAEAPVSVHVMIPSSATISDEDADNLGHRLFSGLIVSLPELGRLERDGRR